MAVLSEILNSRVIMKRRWPYLFWGGVLFCFFLFPLFLLDVGLETMLETRSQVNKKAAYLKLDKKIEKITRYSNSKFYYHALLKKIFEIAHKTPEPLAYLKDALEHLNKRNPGTFSFVVWDKSGNIDETLTDEKGYRYIIRTIHDVFKAVVKDTHENYPGNPETLDLVSKRLNLIRTYLGGFLVPEKLNLPLMAGNLAECVLAGAKSDKAYFWYSIGDELSLFAFINDSAINSLDYLKKLVDGVNRNSTDKEFPVRYGFMDVFEKNSKNNKIIPEIRVALAKFENYSHKNLETDNYLIQVKLFTPASRVFCYINKEYLNIDSSAAYNTVMALVLLILILIGTIVYYLVFKKSSFFSIRWKLALLFVYANGLPLLILGFTGYEYMSQMRSLLVDSSYEDIYGLFEDFDNKFENIKAEYANELNKLIDELNAKNNVYGEKELQKIFDLAGKLNAQDCLISNSKFKYSKRNNRKGTVFLEALFKDLIDYLAIKDYSPQHIFKPAKPGIDDSGKMFAFQKVVLHKFLNKMRRITSEKMAQDNFEYYWNLLGNFENKAFKHGVAVIWQIESLQEEYLKKNISDISNNFAQIKCFARIISNGASYIKTGKTFELEQSLDVLLRQAINLSEIRQEEVTYEGKRYLAYGTVGKILDKVAFVGLFPLDKIESVINDVLLRLVIFALLSIILVSGIALGLSNQFMDPVSEIQKGVVAIAKQNFRHRIPINSEDEFGVLGNAFNTAIESLEELEVAKTVQENLFPQENLNKNKLKVFGRSVTMTRLGGDYFDYFELDDLNVGILMGDVSGHGVPAALVMAAAKASVIMAKTERETPEELLLKIHECIRALNKMKIRRMMTTLYLSVDTQTGMYKIANAGHCYPVIVKKGGNETRFVEFEGSMPLGVVKKAKLETKEDLFNPGDIMFLYTDGIIEAANAAGESLGFDGFSELLKKSYNENIELYYETLFAAYKDWSPTSSDDLTLVIIKYD